MNRTQIFLAAGLVFASARCRPSDIATASEQRRDVMESGALGSVSFSSPSLGRMTISPASCTAGDRQFFLGADFEDSRAGFVLRFVLDPLEGPAFRLFSRTAPFEKSVVFRRGDCRTLQFSFNPTTLRIDRVQDYRVSFELDCTSAHGDSISGKVAASHCH